MQILLFCLQRIILCLVANVLYDRKWMKQKDAKMFSVLPLSSCVLEGL